MTRRKYRTLFIVQKVGVYRHGTVGIFTTVQLAKEAALKAAYLKRDGYHTFDCETLQIDQPEPLPHYKSEIPDVFVLTRKAQGEEPVFEFEMMEGYE